MNAAVDVVVLDVVVVIVVIVFVAVLLHYLHQYRLSARRKLKKYM